MLKIKNFDKIVHEDYPNVKSNMYDYAPNKHKNSYNWVLAKIKLHLPQEWKSAYRFSYEYFPTQRSDIYTGEVFVNRVLDKETNTYSVKFTIENGNRFIEKYWYLPHITLTDVEKLRQTIFGKLAEYIDNY